MSLEEAYGNTQTSTMQLLVKVTQKSLSTEIVQIGWVVCYLGEPTSLKSFFKWLMFGYFAKPCAIALIDPIDPNAKGSPNTDCAKKSPDNRYNPEVVNAQNLGEH